jgi:diketogulonate reductase-like aldo/keto reductase
MERLFDAGTLHRLGVSNVTEEQLRILLDGARVKPSFVQNRCYARLGWDAKVQEVCRRRGVRYQGFSLLTANREALAKPEIRALANELEVKVPQLVFAFARHLGMLPLTGTSDEVHMREDIESVGVVLTREQLMVVAKAGL